MEEQRGCQSKSAINVGDRWELGRRRGASTGLGEPSLVLLNLGTIEKSSVRMRHKESIVSIDHRGGWGGLRLRSETGGGSI